MEYDTYYYMTHPPDLTYEDMLRDEECWDDTIKEKNNKQPFLMKEEDEPSRGLSALVSGKKSSNKVSATECNMCGKECIQ